MSLLPAVALLGLLLFVIYTSVQLAANDARLDTLENNSFPTLEKADAVNFQFSRLPRHAQQRRSRRRAGDSG